MAKYRFVGRFFDGFEGSGDNRKRKRFENGDMVELSDEQYAAFKDQFVLPDEPKPTVKPVEAPKEAPKA